MTSRLDIPYASFFSGSEKPSNFQDLIARCLTKRLTLRARLAAEGASMEVVNDPCKDLQLIGHWRSPGMCAVPAGNVGAKVLLPLLFNPAEIRIPYAHFFTLGHPYRSIADLLARNLFLAITRDAPVSLVTTSFNDAPSNKRRQFRNSYYYILKTAFPEAMFGVSSTPEALDLVLANAYLPVCSFDNPLLRVGADMLRNRMGSSPEANVASSKARVIAVRETMMNSYKG